MPVSLRHPSPQRCRSGFTLIELLTAIAVIGILATITFGVMRGVGERSRIRRAEADLAVIAQGLEQYRAQFGDYPRTRHNNAPAPNSPEGAAAVNDAHGILFNALVGKRGPTGAAMNRAAFAQIDALRLQSREAVDLPDPTNTTNLANAFVDPWGRRYAYYYDPQATGWQNRSYVLYSLGPDGAHEAPGVDGYPDFQHAANIDNIYANRN